MCYLLCITTSDDFSLTIQSVLPHGALITGGYDKKCEGYSDKRLDRKPTSAAQAKLEGQTFTQGGDMEPERGIKRVILSDGAIKHVVVEDAMGNERTLAAVDYISEGIQPPLETLPEVPAQEE
jgi:hypothetical protein